MNVSADDFRQHYQSLSDIALLEIDTSELVPVARACHEEEVAKRGLSVNDATPDESSVEAISHDEEERAELVCIAEYDDADEADLARGMLEADNIPATIESEPGVVRLMVPTDLAEDALRMLATTPLSDEELAAQAEAAGLEEDELLEEELEEEGAEDKGNKESEA